ncbi:MAG TPA: hypothetical protein VGE12_10885 [Noviherbaspirillum sp.]
MKFKSIALAVLIAAMGFGTAGASIAQQAKMKTVAELHKERVALAGKTIRAQGKVVKANNGIRGHNFVHVQDGTGSPGSTNNLIVRSKQTANVGDQVVITGMVVVDKDFGAGYFYPLIIEEATIAPKK